MNDITGIYIIGIASGIVMGLAIAKGIEDISTDSYKNQIKAAIELCEHDLPRYQHCKLSGVVEK